MNISAALDACRAARVPSAGLAALAPLRRLAGVQIVETADGAWVQWNEETPAVVRALLPVAGIVFYARHAEHWRPLGVPLPDFAVPYRGTAVPIDRAVTPAQLEPLLPPKFVGNRVRVTIVPSSQPRPTTGLLCSVAVLAAWCEHATTREIENLRGAVSDQRVWLRGATLPALLGAERFWGERVLTPLGMHPDPDWPENPLRVAAGVDEDEILVLTPEGPETLPMAALRPISRAAVRKLARAI